LDTETSKISRDSAFTANGGGDFPEDV
jgi:hypothetical protein